MPGALGLVLAYACGSFPSAYLAGRMLKGVDLRTVGSGNLGATNVYRELGVAPAIVVLLLDALKGWFPVAMLPGILGAGVTSVNATWWWAIAFGAAAIAGHAKPVFLLGRGGGKGVATGAGVFVALNLPAALVAIAAFVLTLATTRYVSVGSIVGALAVPIATFATVGVTPVFYASLPIAAFVCWGHRANLQRLRAGTEPKFGRPGKVAT